MERIFCVKTRDKNQIITESEAIENALAQGKDGIIPHYSWYDYKEKENVTPPGWLVWSSCTDGCGVVYRRQDGKMIVLTGMQGDFIYN